LLAGLVGFAALIGIIAAATYTDSSTYQRAGFQKITMDHMFNETFTAMHKTILWVPEGEVVFNGIWRLSHSIHSRAAGDGVYSVYENNYIKLVDLKTNTTKNLVAEHDVRDVSNLLVWMGECSTI
jgi:dipeptidyl aminopeptidase B